MTQVYETKLNVFLSQILNQMGVECRSEYIGKGRKDILVYHQGLAIVLEGSFDKRDAENDAKRRIEQLGADVALAIHYPRVFSQKLTEGQIKDKLSGTALPTKIIVPEDISDTLFRWLHGKDIIARAIQEWQELRVEELATLLREVAQFVISEDVVRKTEAEVGDLVERFVTHLTLHRHSDRIATNLYESLYKLYGFSIGDPRKIKEAIFAQATLAIFLASVYYESISYMHSLNSLNTLTCDTGDAQRALHKAIQDILAINYEPIFELVRDMLKAFPSMRRHFRTLVDQAVRVASRKALLRRDIAGKIYHKVAGDWALKKGLATYFTQIPAAYLLLYLARPGLCRTADFACGTGTLLVAAYSAALNTHRLDLLTSGIEKNPAEIERDFHLRFVKSCYAFDVLRYATQITALNIALHSPETPMTEPSPVYAMPLGFRREDQTVSLGSLEFARHGGKTDQLYDTAMKTGTRAEQEQALSSLYGLAGFDLIAMNPPFSRTTGRGGRSGGGLFGFMSDEDCRKAVLHDYNDLRSTIRHELMTTARRLIKGTDLEPLLTEKDLRHYTSIWQAGEGLLFLYLADTRLKEGGKLCFVLPRAFLSGVSWFLARALLASKYHIEYIVVSYETGSYNFSESTSLSECLVVAKKVGSQGAKGKAHFVILLTKPRTSMEAIGLSNLIRAGTKSFLQVGGAKAFVKTVSCDGMLANLDNWGRFVCLPSVGILELVEKLLAGALSAGKRYVHVPVTKLDKLISSIGVDAHRFIDTFQFVKEAVPGSVRMLKGGEEAQRRTMKVSPNAYALPIIHRGREIFERVGGTLLVPDRIRVDTAHVIAMVSDRKTISNIFYAVRLKDESPEKLKALCLWLNTTWGILSVLSSRLETEGGFIRLKMSQWRLLPVLDVDHLPESRLQGLARVFDQFCSVDLPRIPKQYDSEGSAHGLRMELDSAFLRVFDVQPKPAELKPLYREIAQSLRQWLGT